MASVFVTLSRWQDLVQSVAERAWHRKCWPCTDATVAVISGSWYSRLHYRPQISLTQNLIDGAGLAQHWQWQRTELEGTLGSDLDRPALRQDEPIPNVSSLQSWQSKDTNMTSPNYLWDILGFVSETETERWAGERQASELSFSPYLTDNGYLLDYLPLYPWCLLLCCFRQNKPNNNEPSSNWQLLPAQLTLAEKQKANDD